MFWSSLVVAILIVGLVLVAFRLLRMAVEARQQARDREQALEQKEIEGQGLSTALSHFRHNLRDLLDGVGQARQLAVLSLDREQPEQAAQALDLLAQALAASTRFVSEFRPERAGEEQPAQVDLGLLAAGLGRLLEDETHQVEVSDELRGWLVTAPPVGLAVLLGNLVRNAVEAATEVRLLRRGDAVTVENPVGPADLELLRSGSAFEPGVSSKGDGRGIGLDSAGHLAATCGVVLGHETFEHEGRDWVRFTVTFPEPALKMERCGP